MSFKIDAWSVDCSNTAQSVKNLFKGYMRFVTFTKVKKKNKDVFNTYMYTHLLHNAS